MDVLAQNRVDAHQVDHGTHRRHHCDSLRHRTISNCSRFFGGLEAVPTRVLAGRALLSRARLALHALHPKRGAQVELSQSRQRVSGVDAHYQAHRECGDCAAAVDADVCSSSPCGQDDGRTASAKSPEAPRVRTDPRPRGAHVRADQKVPSARPLVQVSHDCLLGRGVHRDQEQHRLCVRG